MRGGTVDENAALLRESLSGAPGPQLDVVLINSGAALLAGDKVETLQQGVDLAREVINSGHALAKLEHLIEFSQSFTQGAKNDPVSDSIR